MTVNLFAAFTTCATCGRLNLSNGHAVTCLCKRLAADARDLDSHERAAVRAGLARQAGGT